MSDLVLWIAAEAERPRGGSFGQHGGSGPSEKELRGIKPHTFHGEEGSTTKDGPGVRSGQAKGHEDCAEALNRENAEEHREVQELHPADLLCEEEERARRIYRGRTVAMLRRYMRYSLETGRLPSILGQEFFRAKVTSYTVVTFEDRVIFVHDMETCLNKLDEFSRQIIARHILQEHDQAATARLLHCTDRTVRTYVPIALDLMAEILLDVGLLERIVPIREKSCQGGKTGKNFVSACEESKNKL